MYDGNKKFFKVLKSSPNSLINEKYESEESQGLKRKETGKVLGWILSRS